MKVAKAIIDKYYGEDHKAREILIAHGKQVRDKALWIAQKNPHLNVNTEKLVQAAMLHDIGILFTSAPEIGCNGPHPYICHGYLGRELLEREGLQDIALIAERHTGTGLSIEVIKSKELPVPHRDMLPVTIEEQIICFADKFYSKGKFSDQEIPLEKVRKKLAKHGPDQLERFDTWCEMFL
jgi:uncharacterized protein